MTLSHAGADAVLSPAYRPINYLEHPIRIKHRPPAGFEAELRDDGLVWVRDDDNPAWRPTKFRGVLRAKAAAARNRR